MTHTALNVSEEACRKWLVDINCDVLSRDYAMFNGKPSRTRLQDMKIVDIEIPNDRFSVARIPNTPLIAELLRPSVEGAVILISSCLGPASWPTRVSLRSWA